MRCMKSYTIVVNTIETNLIFMKNLLFTISALLGMQLAVAQSVATNFTVEDCDGEMYDLFQELDAGKVVVITWIMPCAPCISPTVNAYLVAQEYEQDKVTFLLVDDYANTSCSQLQTWSSNYQMNDVKIFSNSQISMSDYGGDGMPKAVVVGCNSHKVYFNRNFDQNSSTDGLSDAIDLALSECTTSSTKTQTNDEQDFEIYPNPATQHIVLSSKKQGRISFTIVNPLGVIVKEDIVEAGGQIDISHFPAGNYLVNIKDDNKRISFIKSK